ncbi:hypothetical protein BKA61DRAFT_669976 [Leptodontidium sp. MPI-SDFR-AT-0119]|nr:hypothetical protein BKA61DRAFT_669976 [Leptodontidium sp. MPI-SDFR-AT-0119]
MSNPLAKFNGYFHDNGDIITEYPARIRHEWEDLGNGAIEAFYQFNRMPNGEHTFRYDILEIVQHNMQEFRKLSEGVKFTIQETTSSNSKYVIKAKSQALSDLLWRHRRPQIGTVAEIYELDRALLYHCMSYFGLNSDTTFAFNTVTVSQTTSNPSAFARLPVEVQLEVIDKMSLHEADEVIRHSFPHLIPRWLPTIPKLFEKWLNELTSPVNMRLLGSANVTMLDSSLALAHTSRSVNIYRLRSIDMHPNLIIGSSSIIPQPTQPPAEDPLREAKKHFMTGLLPYYYVYRGITHTSERDPTCDCLSWHECEKCPGESLLPIAIPLDSNIPATDPHPSPSSYLLLFEDELHSIFGDLDVATRPELFNQNQHMVRTPHFESGMMLSLLIDGQLTEFEWASSGITDVLGELGTPSKTDIRNNMLNRLRGATPVRAHAPVIDGGTTARPARDILCAVLSLASVAFVVIGF